MPLLVDAMSDPARLVREQADWAVARISGVEPYHAEDDPVQRRRKAIHYYRKYWEQFGTRITEYHWVHNKR